MELWWNPLEKGFILNIYIYDCVNSNPMENTKQHQESVSCLKEICYFVAVANLMNSWGK